MEEGLLVLGKKEILALLKEKYGDAMHIELYIDYGDEGVEGNDSIIAEIHFPEKGIHLSKSYDFVFDEKNSSYNEEYADYITKENKKEEK